MAGPPGGRDQTSNDPTDNFSGSGPAQFGPSYYPIDSELASMSASYNLPGYARSMEDVASSVDKMEHGGMNNLTMDTNRAAAAAASVVDPAMAPPQTPSQPGFVASGGRPSLDASAESPQEFQTGDKRKRSKASRACDECRRKKVKCDAPTDVDGTPKTCTNCVKAKVNCEFERKPMKRGPSKGYISALAERVQGLEQKQRQSFDAGPGGYSDSFSPDEQTGPGFNRAPSFSGPTPTNPFSRSEYSRERMPSIGWSNSQSEAHLRSRAVGSLAVAPHETFATAIQDDGVNLKSQLKSPSQTLFTHTTAARPTKRQRTEGPDSMPPSVAMDEGFLTTYYQQYHLLFALLPEEGRVRTIVATANPITQLAFITAVDLLPDLRAESTVNGNHNANNQESNANVDPAISLPRKSLKTDQFSDYNALQEYIRQQATTAPFSRSEEESLVLIWAIALLALSCENDVRRLKDAGPLPKSDLLLAGLRLFDQIESWNTTTATSATPYAQEVDQALICLCVSLGHHALSLGISAANLFPAALSDDIANFNAKNLPLEARYLATGFNLYGMLSSVILRCGEAHQSRPVFSAMLRKLFHTHFCFFEGSLDDTTIAKEFNCFLELTLAPYVTSDRQSTRAVFAILTWVDKLTNVLVDNAKSNAAPQRYNPLDLHTWSVAALTLGQFVADVSSKAMADYARDRLDELRVEVQKKSDAFHKTYGFEWFFGGNMEHWTDTLLAMIDYVKAHPVVEDQPAVPLDLLVIPDFAGVIGKGFLNSVLFFSKN